VAKESNGGSHTKAIFVPLISCEIRHSSLNNSKFQRCKHVFLNYQGSRHLLLVSPWVKKRLAVFLSPAGMSLTKLSLAGNTTIHVALLSKISFI
jgi:hypothetical protein